MSDNTGKLFILKSKTKDPNWLVPVVDIEENRSVFFPFNTVALVLQELRFVNHEYFNSDNADELVKVLIENKTYLCSRIFLHPFEEY